MVMFIELQHHKREGSLTGFSLFLRSPSSIFPPLFLELCPGLLLPTHCLMACVREDFSLSKITPF